MPTVKLNFNSAVWLGGFGICMLFLALRWNNYDLPLIRDEGEYTYAATLLKHGDPPYLNSFLQKPPMVIYTYALASSIMPDLFWSARLIGYFFIAGSTILLGWIARHEFGPGIAMTTMWLFTPMVLLPELDQFSANTEMFLLLPLLAAVMMYVLARGKNNFWRLCFVAGVFAAVTFWYKYTTLPVLLAVFFCWSVRERFDSGKTKWPWLGWLAWLSGGIFATIVILGFFILRGGLREMWDCTFVFNRFYAVSTANFGWAEFFYNLFGFLKNWYILLIPAFAVITCRNRRLLFWGALFFSAWIATARSAYPQYYMIVMPFWALLSAVGIHQLAKDIAGKIRWPLEWIHWPLAMIVIAFVCLPDLNWMMYSKTDFLNNKLNTTNPFRESKLMAEKVDMVTSANDRIYVAGSEPQIYSYARRKSSTRFIISYPLMIPTPLAENYQSEAIADLEKSKPNAIVFARAEESWLIQKGTPPLFMKYLQHLIGSDYQVVGGTLTAGNDIIWKEPMDFGETTNASLVLMVRTKK